ncbi:MAG: hypothetical protein AAFN81_19445, partial [Bacteroidota bacterium]
MYPRLTQSGALLLICSMLLSTSLFSQIRNQLGLDRTPPTAFDTLVEEIRVPEIDPRQYIILYEWSPSNERKSRYGVKDEYRMREAERYGKLYTQQYTLLNEKKKSLTEKITFLEGAITEEEAVYAKLRDEMENNKEEVPYSERLALSESSDRLDSLDTKVIVAKRMLQQVEADLAAIVALVEDNDYAKQYLRWQYEEENDITEYDGYRPFDFFNDMEVDYAGALKNYEEYYNEIVWRNAGTPDWEPIWWLNQYPWPNIDYRNIDLIDQDYRDQHFALIPYQKYEVIDRKAVLRIVFDKTQLARNEHFKGSIGLDAFLYEGTSDGTQGGDPREIEINPYSVIGEERKSIGLLNRPAGELADNLISLIIKSWEISEIMWQGARENLFEASEDRSQDAQELLTIANNMLDEINATNKSDSLKLIEVKRLIKDLCSLSSKRDYLTPVDDDPYFNNLCYGETEVSKINDALILRLERLREAITLVQTVPGQYQEKRVKLLETRQGLRLITTYLDYF